MTHAGFSEDRIQGLPLTYIEDEDLGKRVI